MLSRTRIFSSGWVKRCFPQSLRAEKILVPALSAALCVTVLAFCLVRFTGGTGSLTENISAPPASGEILDYGTMTVYASSGENTRKQLVLGTSIPLLYNISVVDLRGLDDKTADEKMEAAQSSAANALNDGQGNQSQIRQGSQLLESCYVLVSQINAFDIQPDAEKTVASIRLQCGGYGQLDYCDYRESVALENRFPKGRDLSISGQVYYEIMENSYSLQIMWNPSSEMYTEIESDPVVSLANYSDTLVFTVNYTDGTSARSVVELTFDDAGNMSAEFLGSALS